MNPNEQIPSPTEAPQPLSAQPPVVPQRSNKKLVVGIVSGALLLLIALGAGAWWLANDQVAQYNRSADSYSTTVEEAFVYYRDIDDVDGNIENILEKFDDALAAQPKTPTLLGIALGVPADKKAEVTDLTASLTSLR